MNLTTLQLRTWCMEPALQGDSRPVTSHLQSAPSFIEDTSQKLPFETKKTSPKTQTTMGMMYCRQVDG